MVSRIKQLIIKETEFQLQAVKVSSVTECNERKRNTFTEFSEEKASCEYFLSIFENGVDFFFIDGNFTYNFVNNLVFIYCLIFSPTAFHF